MSKKLKMRPQERATQNALSRQPMGRLTLNGHYFHAGGPPLVVTDDEAKILLDMKAADNGPLFVEVTEEAPAPAPEVKASEPSVEKKPEEKPPEPPPTVPPPEEEDEEDKGDAERAEKPKKTGKSTGKGTRRGRGK